MIQIPLTVDLHFPKGETPVLEFQDRKELEKFVAYLQLHIDVIRGRKKKRLEFFSDGIYFDGELLKLTPREYSMLRAFEFRDKIEEIAFISRVWGDTFIKRITIRSALASFNWIFRPKGLSIVRKDGIYTLLIES